MISRGQELAIPIKLHGRDDVGCRGGPSGEGGQVMAACFGFRSAVLLSSARGPCCFHCSEPCWSWARRASATAGGSSLPTTEGHKGSSRRQACQAPPSSELTILDLLSRCPFAKDLAEVPLQGSRHAVVRVARSHEQLAGGVRPTSCGKLQDDAREAGRGSQGVPGLIGRPAGAQRVSVPPGNTSTHSVIDIGCPPANEFGACSLLGDPNARSSPCLPPISRGEHRFHP